jgi:kinesin family protein 15
MESDKDRIKVVCRIKPLDSKERAANARQLMTVSGSDTITIKSVDPRQPSQSFTFDQIVDESQSQQFIFNNVGMPLLRNSFLLGYNTTIMAYGQTGSGKSFTVFGPSTIFNGPSTGASLSSSTVTDDKNSLVGLVPRIMDYIFAYMAGESKNKTFSTKCSFFEIYQEKVIDLLNDSSNDSSGLSVREDTKHGVFVDGLTEEVVKSSADVSKVLGIGYNNRHVGETNMNRESSRSHAVFMLTVNRQERIQSGDDFINKTIVSKLTLVDLAGSERQKSTNAAGNTLKEASQINKSLTVLGQVINSLVDSQIHVPFRDSKLTFLLRDSLGGNSKTLLIAAIAQNELSIPETISTLKFAQRVKNIKTKVSKIIMIISIRYFIFIILNIKVYIPFNNKCILIFLYVFRLILMRIPVDLQQLCNEKSPF